MTLESLKKEIQLKCRELGIPLVGFAPVVRWEHPPPQLPNTFRKWIPEDFWPQSIYPETRTVIVIGLPVPLPIVETAPSIFYHELYHTVNALLDEKAYLIANFLTEKGYPSIHMPRDGYGDIEVLLKKPLTFFSHKYAAYLAGLGSIGHNNILLTPEYGPRVRFTSIFTTAQLEGSPIRIGDLCTYCMRCTVNCPTEAIPQQIEKKGFFQSIDKIKCAKRSKKLRSEYRAPCGICIKVCPVGKDREVFNRTDMSIYSSNDDYQKYHKAWKHVQSYGSKKR